jgi:quercetin dioxygenase-like cupin family protein
LNERKIVCEDLNLAIDDLRREGFRLDVIYPADDPKAAVLSRGIERVRVSLKDAPLLLDRLAPFVPAFVLTRAGASPAAGRAEMLYRDLIPGRLGGRYVASHITIPEGGTVDDWVHYHRVALQIIVVRRGWVRVVYEDQGEPFVMKAGDVVLQPPGIRHRVLESSVGLEVVEISAPALHETFADHELELPNARPSDRSFGRQSFLHQLASKTPWSSFHQAEARETAMRKATGGLADVRTIRRGSASTLDVPPHDGELVLGFVLDGRARLVDIDLGPADAFVIRPSEAWSLKDMSEDFRLLHITTARLD